MIYTEDSVCDKMEIILHGMVEISMIYECKRTATVVSENYGSIVKLTKSNLHKLSQTFEGIQNVFKNDILSYKDP